EKEEAEHEEDSDEVAPELQNGMFESLGTVHSCRDGAGTSGEAEDDDDAEE
ncbi:hypothetical protein HAX54_028093, partial [Datura stramonium]|nr:hypothetical protein [Datura stramonium]